MRVDSTTPPIRSVGGRIWSSFAFILLWVHAPTGEWSVFDPEGRWLGNPGKMAGRILWIGDDIVIRRRSHPDTGVETVEGLRLNRHGGRFVNRIQG